MGIIKARIQNENGEYSWADIATSSQHIHKVSQLEDNSILATKADLGLEALVDENGNPITDEQGNQKYNSLAQIFHDWLSDIKKDQPDWKETNTASPNYIQNKPATIIETINNMPPDEEGNVKVDTLPAIGLGQDNFVLSAVRKNENTEEYQAEWKEVKVLPNFTQGDTDSVLTVTNEENVPKIEWKKPNCDWNNISNKPNLINTLAEQDSINTDNLSEELIEKIENSGLEVKTGTTDPDVLTAGELGQIYVNTTSNTGFVCVKVSENEYIWQAIGGTVNTDDSVQSDWLETDTSSLAYIKNKPENIVTSVNGQTPDEAGNIQISPGEVSDALIAAHNSDPTAHEDMRSAIDNSIMIDKSFGNGPDTVAEGDHIHGDLQLQIQSVEEVINADYYDNSNSVEFFTEITPSHTLWSATSSSKVTGVDIIGGRYTCTTSVAEQGLKTSNLTDLVDVVKGKTIVGVADLSSDNYTLYIKMHNGTSWSFGRIKSTDKIVTVQVPDNLTQFKLGLEYGGDGSAPDTCVMTNFALYLVNDVTITSTANIPNRNYTIWSWDDEEIINPEEFASFCNAYKINRVYQHVSTSVLDLETIRKFVGTMQKNRISVNWLTGDPLWALAEHHYHIAEQIQKVVSYNMSIQNDYEKIGTIQFDIEPHALDEWNADQASVIKQYQDAVVLMYKESLAKQLSLNVCVPSWFDSVAYDNEYGQGNLFDFVSKHSSSTIIMAYNTKSYVSIAEDEIRMGALNGKNVAVGLETHEITESITEDISFANKPIEDLYRAFETLFLVYKIYGVYKGYEFVIHDYGYFKAYTDKFNLTIPPNNILDKLTTENKTDLISAINEINTEVEQLKTKYPEGGGGGGNCSCPTGTIEKDVTIDLDTSVTPTVKFDIANMYTAHKIANETPTKEQILSAQGSFSLTFNKEEVYDLLETDILFENNDIIGANFVIGNERDMLFVYAICYTTGEITVNYSGVDIVVNVPETGMYQVWDFGQDLPTEILGSLTYTEVKEVNFVQSNWNQTDYTKPDYIKHKPFGEVEVSDTLINGEYNATYDTENGLIPAIVPITSDIHLTVGKEYTVFWNGEEYKTECFLILGMSAIGNPALLEGENNNLPFAIAEDLNGNLFGEPGFIVSPAEITSTTMTFNVKVVYEGTATKKIDAKYLYQPDWNENDKSKSSYIVNKPFGTWTSGITAVDTSVTMMTESENVYIAFGFPVEKNGFIDGGKYNVTFNGNTYENCTCFFDASVNAYAIIEPNENVIIADSHPNLSGMSFVMVYSETSLDGVACDLKVVLAEDCVKKIDSKYLPDNIGSGGSGLPESTTSDSGKVLTVGNDGSAMWSTPASGLPNVTTSDNNKVLKVVNGIWTTAEETTELPDVTTSDNGKILSVIENGSIAWKEYVKLPAITTDTDEGKMLTINNNTIVYTEFPLPLPTAENEGQFLRVIGGVATWTTVENAEEVNF